jgi:copper homeostasis protein
MMNLEICIDSVESAIAAERGGAQRVELCADLLEGGITPSAGMIASVRSHISIELFVMIRPRGGDFCYSDLEFEVMKREIEHARGLGADGIVLGLLDDKAHVDLTRARQLVERARPLPVTFHRAFDMTPDLPDALEDVIATGARRILTSGGAPNVTSGMSQIAQMVRIAKERIAIMPGGGVSMENIVTLAEATGAEEFHSTARMTLPSPMCFRKQGIAMGDVPEREYDRFIVSEEKVRALARALEDLGDKHARGDLG